MFKLRGENQIVSFNYVNRGFLFLWVCLEGFRNIIINYTMVVTCISFTNFSPAGAQTLLKMLLAHINRENKKSCSTIRLDFHLFLIQGTCSPFPPLPSLPSCLSFSFMSIRDSMLPDLIGLTFLSNRSPSEGRAGSSPWAACPGKESLPRCWEGWGLFAE